MKKYNLALVVGRFQPPHLVHIRLIEHALEQADTALIALGSAKSAPDVKNPFTPQLREEMILSCFTAESRSRLKFVHIRDYPYNDNIWIAEMQQAVRNELEKIIDLSGADFPEVEHNREIGKYKVALVGHYKDQSSYYLKLFPQWTFESFYENTKEAQILNATDIRKLLFEDKNFNKFVPHPVARRLHAFKKTPIFAELQEEYNYIQQYKADTAFKGVPFAPIFMTTDNVVTAMGHILLVKRGGRLGKGLYALPGGFVQPELRLFDNAIKELKEETQINIHKNILRSNLAAEKVFDNPNRSLRGRTITYAYHIALNPNQEDGLPLIKGGDDAAHALWMPIASIAENEDKFFEDHIHIIRHFLGV